MPSKEYVLDGQRFSTLAEAASEFTQALGLSKPWTGNLDVFDDLLATAGNDSGEQRKVIVWRNSDCSRQKLNHNETALWYERHLLTCHTSTFSFFEQRLAEAQEGRGPTLFDWLVEIIRGHQHLDLRLE